MHTSSGKDGTYSHHADRIRLMFDSLSSFKLRGCWCFSFDRSFKTYLKEFFTDRIFFEKCASNGLQKMIFIDLINIKGLQRLR